MPASRPKYIPYSYMDHLEKVKISIRTLPSPKTAFIEIHLAILREGSLKGPRTQIIGF